MFCCCWRREKERGGERLKLEIREGERERKCKCVSTHQVKWRGKNNQQRLVVYSLLQELARRDGLSRALSGRNEQELYPILLFTRFSILEPKYSSFMLDVFDLILGEMCGAPLGTCMRAHRHMHEHTLTLTLSRTTQISMERHSTSRRQYLVY